MCFPHVDLVFAINGPRVLETHIKTHGVILRHKDVNRLLEHIIEIRNFAFVFQLKHAVEDIADSFLVIHQDAEGRGVVWQQEFFTLLVFDDVTFSRLIDFVWHV